MLSDIHKSKEQSPKIITKNKRILSSTDRRSSMSGLPENAENSPSTPHPEDTLAARQTTPVPVGVPVAVPMPDFRPFTEKVPGTSIKIEMIPIPGGKMILGSPPGESGRETTDLAQKEATIKPFYMAQFETSWEQVTPFIFGDFPEIVRSTEKVDGMTNRDYRSNYTEPFASIYRNRGVTGYPAIGMSYFTAREYCRWLNKKTGKKYRLPTEQEWEYACRAGSKEAFFWGNNSSRAAEYAWFRDNSNGTTQPVGKLKSNAYSLYDIAGNVMEWCAKENAQQPGVARGGAWSEPVNRLRSAARIIETPEWNELDPQVPQGIWWLSASDFIGFRVVCAFDDANSEPKSTADIPSNTQNEAVKVLFRKAGCAGCHGDDGRGKTKLGIKMGTRDYTDATVKASLNNAEMQNAIKNGVTINGKIVMQGAIGKLTDAEIMALAEYLSSF